MVNSFLQLLGISNPDNVVTSVVVALLGTFTIVLSYKFLDFILNLITAIVGKDKDIKF